MTRLICDHFRRWWWVLALAGTLEFGLGWTIVNRPQDNFEFWGLLLALWAGANLLNFDLRRGLARVMATLPLTATQIGCSWWLATVALPAIVLAVLLFLGAGVSCYLDSEHGFPLNRLALASLFTLMWLGITSIAIFNSIPGIFRGGRVTFFNGLLSTLSTVTLLGGMIFFQDASKTTLKTVLLLAVGSLLTVASWFRAGQLSMGRAESLIPRSLALHRAHVQSTNARAHDRAPGKHGGISFLVVTCLRGFLYIASMVGLMALIWPLAGNGPSWQIAPLAGLMSCWFVFFYLLLPMLRELRAVRTLPVSAARLAAGMITIAVFPLIVLGALMAGIAGLTSGFPTAVKIFESYTIIGGPAALCVFLAVWRGGGMDGYAWVFCTMFGFYMTPQLLKLFFHWESSHGQTGAIVAICVLLAFFLTRRTLMNSSRAYRSHPNPFGNILTAMMGR